MNMSRAEEVCMGKKNWGTIVKCKFQTVTVRDEGVE